MRLAAKWRGSAPRSLVMGMGDLRQSFILGGQVEVVRMGAGDPIVVVPGLAGGWKLVAPLARQLASRHEVILFGFRGDRVPSLNGDGPEGVASYSEELARLISDLRLE